MQIPSNSGKVTLDKLAHIAREELTDATEFPADAPRLYQGVSDGYRMDYLWSPNPEHKRLFVFFSGDARRGTNDPPVFQRWSWARHMPGSCLYVSDPSLHLAPDIGLAWYSGTSTFDPLKAISALMARLVARFGFTPENIFSYGSSGGGFAALRFGALNDGIGVITINPQIVVSAFEPASHLKRYAKTCFDGMEPQQAVAAFPDRFNMLENVEALRKHRLIYVQNTMDVEHYDDHYLPFCKAMGAPSTENTTEGNFRRVLFEHPEGHTKAETPEAFATVLEIVTRDFSPG